MFFLKIIVIGEIAWFPLMTSQIFLFGPEAFKCIVLCVTQNFFAI